MAGPVYRPLLSGEDRVAIKGKSSLLPVYAAISRSEVVPDARFCGVYAGDVPQQGDRAYMVNLLAAAFGFESHAM